MPPDLYGFPGTLRSIPVYANPASVDKCLCWFRPAGIIGANGTEMTTWVDSGPRILVPAATGGAGARSTISTGLLNRFTVATSGGLSQGLRVPSTSPGFSLTSPDTWTVFTVINWSTAGTTENGFMGMALNARGFRIALDGATGKLLIVYTNVGGAFTNEIPSLNQWHYLIVTANATALTAYLDGVALTGLGNMTMDIGTVFPTTLDIGVGFNSANYLFRGSMAEFAMFDSAVSASERAILQTYAHNTYLISGS
jgi:hypothetical protein